MGISSLPLSDILSVAVVVSPAAVPGPTFNQGLIIGSSTIIPIAERIRLYSSLDDVVSDFGTSCPEYYAAASYFGQTPQPTYLWIGRRDLSSIEGAAIHSGNAGNGYNVNDTASVTQGGASGGAVKVTAASSAVATVGVHPSQGGTGYAVGDTVSPDQVGGSNAVFTVATISGGGSTGPVTGLTLSTAGTGYQNGSALLTTTLTGGGAGLKVDITSGVPTAISVLAQGTGYSAGNGLSAVALIGTGSGLEVDITSNGLGETPLQAVTACRIAQPLWYCCTFVGTALKADHQAIAEFIEGCSPNSMYFITYGASEVLDSPTSNLFTDLKALKLRRTFSLYSTTQNGAFPTNVYGAAALMGFAMGMNTGAAGSYFDVMFKGIAELAPEPLSQSQVNAICGPVDRSLPGMNANAMVYYANGAYSWVQSAIMASGDFFDEVLNLDMLASDMQYSGVNLLVSVPALPITDGGVTMMKNVLAQCCDRAKERGFIAPSGVWKGVNIGTGRMALNNNDALPSGYYIYAPAVSTMSEQDRAARRMPPFTVLLCEAQSAHSLKVTLDVQR